ncbi:Bifunctional 3-dehydroquinate dehydratase/shikimate dehydrogenase, chloroplastic [Triticum urartu]|uniref:SDH C-terminal domain-containing protein n=2 Tax=Triticum TaxID=4564 RepID=A0A9R0RIN1_TRITD|nr:Bifunctional 3-dehydroquinate dehydratase/shikimate dehydrogenase, chloroplastic [Triticum urartu]VAH60651.1 unnamed protein product [Triticum turgidum subsp. durum]
MVKWLLSMMSGGDVDVEPSLSSRNTLGNGNRNSNTQSTMWQNFVGVRKKAVTLANAVGGQALRLADLENFRPEEGTILANATSLGMYPNVDGTPVPKKALRFYDVVFDAVYAPKVTRLLREAKEHGVKVVSGVEMFVRQAMGQFEHFTGGIEAPESLMREIAAQYT